MKALILGKKSVLIASVVAVVLLVVGGTVLAAARLVSEYKEKFLPNTIVAGLDISGKTRPEAAETINAAFDAYLNKGLDFRADGKDIRLNGSTFDALDSAVSPLLSLDADQTLGNAFKRGHSGSLIKDGFTTILALAKTSEQKLVVSINQIVFQSELKDKLTGIENPVKEPSFEWRGGALRVVAGESGRVFDLNAASNAVSRLAEKLASGVIEMKSELKTPATSDAEERLAAETAEKLLRETTLILTYGDKSWNTATSTRALWLQPARVADDVRLSIASSSLDPSLDAIKTEIEIEPRDARFEIIGGRVEAFEESRDGVAIDLDLLAERVAKDWVAENKTQVEIPVKNEKAKVTTENVNNIGIKEILGVGTSNYSGSPVNRIKNIKNAVRKLNGILIKPDETFSLIAALQPFTLGGGWLPEKVIKGNKIKPEIGGGACQIGTTAFRAAMMSGLPIVERQNHSLVVKYYNDPTNGNPGTDATIYEPSPDFKFKNDTGHYILFQAAINEAKGNLIFTFWGTSDGRQGSYTPPVVYKWYPAGTAQEIKTTDLEAGKKDCQSAFRGADAGFTYIVKRPDQSEEKRVFTSHYRALPQICMIGATQEEIDNAGKTPLPETTPPATNANTNTNSPPTPTNSNTNTP